MNRHTIQFFSTRFSRLFRIARTTFIYINNNRLTIVIPTTAEKLMRDMKMYILILIFYSFQMNTNSTRSCCYVHNRESYHGFSRIK